jgi:DNA-binding MarR family transcriptional regulator
LIERHRKSPSSRWSQSVSFFSDKSSLILRYLFEHPRVHVHVRDLSRELDVSPGLVSRVLDRLRKDRFLVADGEFQKLVERDFLLDDWKDLYKRRAKSQRERRYYMHVRQLDDVFSRLADYAGRASEPRWALSFQAGASFVRPFAFFSEVHLLVSSRGWEDNVEQLADSLGLESASQEANVILVEPHYRHSWAYGLRSLQGIPVVSDLQLYLDLSAYPRRGAEQAEVMRELLLNPDRSSSVG